MSNNVAIHSTATIAVTPALVHEATVLLIAAVEKRDLGRRFDVLLLVKHIDASNVRRSYIGHPRFALIFLCEVGIGHCRKKQDEANSNWQAKHLSIGWLERFRFQMSFSRSVVKFLC